VYPERMKHNLNLTGGLIFSQKVLLKLMEKGLDRPAAYPIVQRIAMQAHKEEKNFQELLLKDKEMRKHLTRGEISESFDLKYYLRNIDNIFKRLLK
ncbi:MAG: adenylosuccinate lyase, partial [Candidatus Omnitrophica bacterium]|nr:adenylosuccinate lyase [Candidatus Omnitrophota bacterium]